MSDSELVEQTCSMCGGSGKIREEGQHGNSDPGVYVDCPHCGGTGKEITRREKEGSS